MKLLVIGGGINSAVGRVHRDAMALSSYHWQIEAGAFSRNEKLNLLSHQFWGIDYAAHYSAEEILEHYSPHANDFLVLILTETSSHYDFISKAAHLGFSVICEKSLTSNTDELRQLQHNYPSPNYFIRTTFNYSGYPMVRELKALVTEGYIGQPHQLILEMPQEGLVRPPLIQGEYKPPQAWRLLDGSIPTVCLDLGVHLHHLMLYTTSLTPEPVSASFSNFTQYDSIKDTLFCNFSDKKQAVNGSMWFTKSAIGTRNGMNIRIFGSAGSVCWTQQHPEHLHLALPTGELRTIDRASNCLVANAPRYERMKAGHPSGYIEAFANIYDDIASEYIDWKSTGLDADNCLLGPYPSLKGLDFFEDCVSLSAAEL